MTNQPFRFIHTADLHLELPVGGLSECPEYLEPYVLDAPYTAARRLFQYAIHEKVDFIILAGDVLSPSATGPYGLLFLIEEFKKLQTEGIEVYWAGGRVDSPEEIPTGFEFPSNVHVFPVGKMEEFLYLRTGVPTARLIGTSLGKQAITLHPGDHGYDSDGCYTIGVFYGKIHPETVRSDGVQYWALGGEHKRDFLSRSPSTIHYPGTPLARNPYEVGDYGISLVEINELGQTKISMVNLSPTRWVTERIVVREPMTEEAILAEMRGRLKNLRQSLKDTTLFVSWRIDTLGELVQELRYGTLAGSILRDLRSDFGKEEPICYSVEVKPLLSDVHDSELYEQQTILGDYLRMIHYYQEHTGEKLDLTPFFSEELQEYLLVRKRAEDWRNEVRHRTTAEGSNAEEVLSPESEIKSFKSRVPIMLDLLTLDENICYADEFREGMDSAEEKRRQDKKSQRTDALREAAMLGTELLTGDETMSPGRKTTSRSNPQLAVERRNLSQNKEGKESLS